MKPEPPSESGLRVTDASGGESPHLPASPTLECWNRIGVVGGDQSCPELSRYIHCRNCSVFAAAGAKLLDRALPPGYREEWTRRLAETRAEAIAGKKSVLLFRIGGDWFALATEVFKEVSERRVIRSLPHQRNHFVLGLANVRGELLVCISLTRLLGMADAVGATYNRLLVVGWHGQRQAFPVDEIAGTHRFHPQEINETPTFEAGSTYTRGRLNWEGRAVDVLNEEMLFNTLNVSLA